MHFLSCNRSFPLALGADPWWSSTPLPQTGTSPLPPRLCSVKPTDHQQENTCSGEALAQGCRFAFLSSVVPASPALQSQSSFLQLLMHIIIPCRGHLAQSQDKAEKQLHRFVFHYKDSLENNGVSLSRVSSIPALTGSSASPTHSHIFPHSSSTFRNGITCQPGTSWPLN